jgi:hypothetical protein
VGPDADVRKLGIKDHIFDSKSTISASLAGSLNRNGYIRATGKGWKSTCLTDQDGCWITAPLLPQRVHLALRRNASPDVSAPHLIISGASAIGDLWPQP